VTRPVTPPPRPSEDLNLTTAFFRKNRGYLNSVGNLNGWSDGDPFYVNYVGHSMRGAASGDIWTHNDRAYRDIEFGRNRKYWKGKLRGAAYSYLYGVLFEIGPLSEASIGNIQALYPQQGFVDQPGDRFRMVDRRRHARRRCYARQPGLFNVFTRPFMGVLGTT
jgi:hypothetical protein